MIAFVSRAAVPATAATPFPSWLLDVVDIAPVITLLVAIAAIIPAWVAISRNGKSSRQGRWWSEAQWALDASFGNDLARKQAGIRMLKILATEKWLGEHELRVLDAAWLRPIEEASEGRGIDVPHATVNNERVDPPATVDIALNGPQTTEDTGTSKVADVPSSAAHEADRPQTAEIAAEEVVLSLPDDEWAAVKLVGDAIFKEPHGKETQPDISDAKLAGKRGRHETVSPEDAFGISVDQEGAQRLRVFNGWVEEARKAKATGDLPPSKEAASGAEHEVQVEAAQLKMILDRRLNRNTVQWIRDLAES